MEYAIKIDHLTKDYGSFILQDVSLAVPGGTIMGLIGENGAGKSTTIKCILNLIHRDAGTITLLDKDNIAEEAAVKEDIGLVLDESLFHDSLRPGMWGRSWESSTKTGTAGFLTAIWKSSPCPRISW